MQATDGVTVWVDGLLTDPAHARVPALDHGFTVGDGVFESCKVTGGQAFALTRHLRRLARSAAGLGLPAPDDELVRSAVREVLSARHVEHGRLRITWTGGPGPLGSDRGPSGRDGTLVVASVPTPPWPAHVAVTSVPWVRNERSATAGLKTTSYAENVVALQYAAARGAAEALFGNTRGELCEGTGSNVVVAVDGVLATPPLDSGCLAGITRELLLEWAADEGLPIEERALPFTVLATAQEVLLLSSTRDVQVVDVVDDRPLRRGPLGAAAVDLFARRSLASSDP